MAKSIIEQRTERTQIMVSSLAIALACFLLIQTFQSDKLVDRQVDLADSQADQIDRIGDLVRDVDSLYAELRSIRKVEDGPLRIYVSQEIRSMRAMVDSITNAKDVDSLNMRLNRMEAWVLESPEKAVAIPMLKNEMATLRERLVAGETRIDAAIAASDLRHWTVIGLLATILVGIAAPAIVRAITKPKATP